MKQEGRSVLTATAENAEHNLTSLDRRERELSLAERELEAKSAELFKERELFRVTLAGICDAVITTDTQARITFMNPVAEDITGWQLREALDQPVMGVFNVIGDSTREPLVNPVLKVLHEGAAVELAKHTVLIARDGRERAIDDSATPIRDADGKIAGVVLVFRDVTHQRQANTVFRESGREDLLASEKRFRLLVDGVKDYAIFALDYNGMVVSWNSGAERINGYQANEIIGRHFSVFYPEEGLKKNKPVRELRIAKSVGRFEEEGWRVRKDGSQFWASVVLTALHDVQGNLIGFSKITRDLSERRRSEEKLRQSEDKFSKAFRSSPLAVTISTQQEGRYIDVNDAFLRITGRTREKVVGRTALEVNMWSNPEDRGRMLQELNRTGRLRAFETAFNSSGAGRREVQIFAEPIELDGIPCIVAVTEDLTDTRRREALYLQGQKIEATGRLAGGIAHDFNNVLNVILGYCELLLQQVQPMDGSRNHIEQIEIAASRASELTRQLLAFGRRQVLQAKVLNLNSTVNEMRGMLSRLIGEDIEINTSLAEFVWPVKADPTQVVQIVMNLVVNARDAMPAGGQLTIETHNVQLDADCIHTHPEAASGDYVCLSVTDTGFGMDQETAVRIFEPFFTTKELGKGTGLGLSTVYGIVKQSRGFIWVYSEPGHGTAFKVYFPRTREAVGEENVPRPVSGNIRGTETILVVEDNNQLRELAVAFLETSGYTVLEAATPERALDIAFTHDGPIHLLLSDVVLPKMSGRVLAEKLKERYPDTKILFVSGYTDDVIVRHGILHEGVAFLQKPYSRNSLTSKIRTILDHSGNSGAESHADAWDKTPSVP